MEVQKEINLKDEIRKRYGTVRRAYDFHLYTAKGVRLLDLCQEGGAAILGWRSGKSKLAFKNILDRGITGSFPTDVEDELVRAVQEVLPHYGTVRWYASPERARMACASYLGLWSDIPLIESPLLHPEASVDIGPSGDSPLSAAKNVHGVPIWRPWLDEAFYSMNERVDQSFLRNANDTLETMVLASPLPFAGGCTLAVFADRASLPVDGASGADRTASTDFSANSGEAGSASSSLPPPSDSIAPPLLGALARAWCDLSAALFERTEADWSRFDRFIEPFWDRRGPYLVPKMRPSRYAEFFESCLDKGILISPDYRTPSIIPFVADSGEFKALSTGRNK
jgi:hypothetical protein